MPYERRLLFARFSGEAKAMPCERRLLFATRAALYINTEKTSKDWR
jgi:hypothetical protein